MKKIGWLSLAVSSLICTLVLFFPIPLAYLMHSSVRPSGFFAFIASEGRLLLVLAGICGIITVLTLIILSVALSSSERLRQTLDHFFLGLSQFRTSEALVILLVCIAVALATSAIRFSEWSLVVMLSLLVSVFYLSLLRLEKLIVRPEVRLPDVTSPDVLTTESESRTYSWHFDRYGGSSLQPEAFSAGVSISAALLSRYRDEARRVLPPADNWREYPTKATPDVRMLAKAFRELSKEHAFFRVEERANVLSMVQESIPYSDDEDTAPNHEAEYPRYPIETLYDSTGDCECKTFLASALLSLLGNRTALLFYPGHLALGVEVDASYPAPTVPAADGCRFCYCETTATGWSLGVIPPEYAGVEPDAMVIISPEDMEYDCAGTVAPEQAGGETKEQA